MNEPEELHRSAGDRVLHLVPTLDIGGLERVVLALCREQRRRGVDARVLVIGQGTGRLAGQFAESGIPVLFCPKGRGFSPSIVFKIRRELAKMGAAALLHTHDLTALIYASFVKTLLFGGVRVVHTQHSFKHLAWSWRYRVYERIFPAFADHLVCVSGDLRDTYRSFGQPDSRISVIPNGVAFETLAASAASKAEEKRLLAGEYALPASAATKRWLVCLGRLAPGKGQDHLIAAWKLLGETDTRGALLLFVGPESEPGFRARLEAMAQGRACFAGASLEPGRWLRAADAFLSGSEFEGLPMAVLEAAAARVPMLLSEIPGHERFRGLATFFPPLSPGEGAKHLTRFLREGNFAEVAGSAEAFERLKADCGLEKMASDYRAIYVAT